MGKKQDFKTSFIYAVASKEVVNSFRKLYGSRYVNEKTIEYYSKKLKVSAAVAAIGILTYFIYPYMKTPVLTSPYEISRNGYGGGSRTVSLDYKIQGEESKPLELTVKDRKYAEEKIEKLYTAFEDEIEGYILDKNTSSNHVTSDLRFASQIKGYPFSIKYKTDNPALLSYSGKIDFSKLEDRDGELVTIIITVTYEDFRKEIYRSVCIYEKDKTYEEKLAESFENELLRSDEGSKYSEYMRLPDNLNGAAITYFEKGEKFQVLIPVIALIFAVFLLVGNNDDVKKELKKRDAELSAEYPVLINKFAIFYNAGMPINAIWNKLCNEYENSLSAEGQRKYLYEEMLITRTMISDGKNEIESYEDFAKRCDLRQYKVFVSLIQQAITKGKGDMDVMLRKEAEEAFIERKNNAKKLSEEASSKLLLPMFMMLIVVMIMIMFPAFRSFN